MAVLPLVFAVVGFAVNVNSFPSSDVAFPEDINGVQTALSEHHDRFHHGYRSDPRNHKRYPHPRPRRPDYYRPPGLRPGTNYIPSGSGPTRDSRPPFSRPGGNALGSRPNENSRPEDSEGPALNSRPSFSRPEEDFSPQGSRPFGNPRPQRPNQEFTSSRPEGDFRPPFSRPGGNAMGSRPNENSRPEDSKGPALNSRPSFSRPEEDFSPQGSRPFGNPRPQRLNQEFTPSFSRPGGDFRPPSSRPSVGFDTQDSEGSIPSGTTPVESTRPQFSRPDESSRTDEALGSRPSNPSDGGDRPQGSRPDDYSRPDGIEPETPPVFQPDFIAFGSSGESESPNENPNPSGSASFRPEQNSNTPDDLVGPTAPATTETTTKIPRRDPTNRIVYKVTCPCTHAFHYKPVCGSDGQTYGNIGVLQCTQTCGSAVKLYLEGSCGRNNGHPGAISLKY